jgi:hypothetical protein
MQKKSTKTKKTKIKPKKKWKNRKE